MRGDAEHAKPGVHRAPPRTRRRRPLPRTRPSRGPSLDVLTSSTHPPLREPVALARVATARRPRRLVLRLVLVLVRAPSGRVRKLQGQHDALFSRASSAGAVGDVLDPEPRGVEGRERGSVLLGGRAEAGDVDLDVHLGVASDGDDVRGPVPVRARGRVVARVPRRAADGGDERRGGVGGRAQELDRGGDLRDEHVVGAVGDVVERHAAAEAEGGGVGALRGPRPARQDEAAVARPRALGRRREEAGELLRRPEVRVAGVRLRVGRERGAGRGRRGAARGAWRGGARDDGADAIANRARSRRTNREGRTPRPEAREPEVRARGRERGARTRGRRHRNARSAVEGASGRGGRACAGARRYGVRRRQ